MLLVSLTIAAPVFDASHPRDAAIARSAFDAATECTGWSPKTHPVIRLTRTQVDAGFRGMAQVDELGLASIDLHQNDPSIAEVIVHEVAHAWVSAGPTALVEGRTELLADCIVHRRPGIAPLQWDDGRVLRGMPSLVRWESTDDHGPSVNPFQRTDAYLGASRLVRLAALLLPEGAMWPKSGRLDWSDLDALLADAGEPAHPLRVLLKASGREQALALSDADSDGLPTIGEAIFGTDPTRFDSDSDGWWDAAAVQEGLNPLPFDGTPICSGFATPPTGTTVGLVTGGNLRGWPAPTVRLRAGDQVGAAGMRVFGPTSVLLELTESEGQLSGGLWGRVHGDGLVVDDGCRQGPRHVVWARTPALRSRVAEFETELVGAIQRLEQRVPGAPTRVAVSLGGPLTTMKGNIIHISQQDLLTSPLRKLASEAVAMRRVWDATQHREWRDVQALAEAIRDAPDHGSPLARGEFHEMSPSE